MRSRLTGSHPDSPLLLYVGRLGSEKKLERLKSVLDRNPGARLALIGAGPAEDALKEHFKDYPVHFAGQIVGKLPLSSCTVLSLTVRDRYRMSGEELSQAFASADVFVMPSDTETLGFVVLESLASGVPAVGVAAGGLVDTIQNGRTGYLVDNGDDMKEFSAAVGTLIADKELRRRMGTAGVEWAKNWSWEAATDKLRNVQYRRAIALHACRDRWGRHRQKLVDAVARECQ